MDNRISGTGPPLGYVRPNAARNSSEDVVATGINGSQDVQPSARNPIEEQKAIEKFEKTIRAIQGPEKKFEFSIHEKTHTIMVKIFDKQSGELIREIPKEKLLDISANMMELSGILFDKNA